METEIQHQLLLEVPTATTTRITRNEGSTTAVSLWFGKPQSKNNRRYGVVAGWAYKDSTKELRYALWKDQGPAPYLSTLSAWISGLQPAVVLVSCAGGMKALNDDKNLNLWLDDVEQDLQQLCRANHEIDQAMPSSQYEDEEGNEAATTPADAVINLTHVVPSVVPPQANVELLRTLVSNDPSALYQIKANPNLTPNGNATATPLLNAAAVLLQAVGLYQPLAPGPDEISNVHPTLRDLAKRQEHDQQQKHGGVSIQPMPATNFLILDRAAATSLNVWPVSHAGQAALEGATTWHTSLYGLLAHYARTLMGKTQLQQWLLHPLIELKPLVERQDAVAHLVNNAILRQSVVDQGLQLLAGTNLEKLASQLESFEEMNPQEDDDQCHENAAKNKTFTGSTRKALQALYELYVLAVQKVPALTQQLEPVLAEHAETQKQQQQGTPSPLLVQCAFELLEARAALDRAVGLAEAVLDLELAPREFVVKPSHLPELAELANELAQWQADLDKCHQDMNDEWIEAKGLPPSNSGSMYVKLQILDSKGNGDSYDYQFRLPDTNDAKFLQEHKDFKKSITVHRILKSGVCFSNVTLKQLGSQKRDLNREYDRHQRQVVANAMSVAASYAPIVQRVRKAVAILDAIAAMAQLAIFSETSYCRPTLTDSDDDGNGICLSQARHPCVECQDNVTFIPNDIELTLGPKSCWLVTGPNMGGKSTFIRSVGAIVTLAQIGSYVPCNSAKINLVHNIAARVGAGDLQDRGISTFMSEMLEASAILQTASRRSLIIVDELGRGTSTFDGYGLAQSICEYVVDKIRCLTVFATHFHELTATLPAQFPNGEVHNCHVSATTTDKDVVFLYKVQDGPCLESFGIPVAEMAQIPHRAIIDAKAKLQELESGGRAGSKRPHPDGDNNDKQWLSKFQKLNVPALDNEALRRAVLQGV